MSTWISTGLSTAQDRQTGAMEAAVAARDSLGRRCDLAVVTLSGAHLAAPEIALDVIHGVLEPGTLVGCGAAGVVADGQQIEDGTAVAVWAASFDDGTVSAFAIDSHGGYSAARGAAALEHLHGASGALVIADPYSFAAEATLDHLSRALPNLPLVGGLASGRAADADTPLMLGDQVVNAVAVVTRFEGVGLVPCVSFGARPVGPEMTVTAADGRVLKELAGKPALSQLRKVIGELSPQDRRGANAGVLLGIVVQPDKSEYVEGDFVLRPLVAADPRTSEVTAGTTLEEGQIIRLHVRDPASADLHLRETVRRCVDQLTPRSVAGALLMVCNGRGFRMFGEEHHDVTELQRALGNAPIGGFLAAGEIGPIRGRHVVQSLSATAAIFPTTSAVPAPA